MISPVVKFILELVPLMQRFLGLLFPKRRHLISASANAYLLLHAMQLVMIMISDNVLFTSAGAMQLLDVEDERLAALYSGSGVHAYTPISVTIWNLNLTSICTCSCKCNIDCISEPLERGRTACHTCGTMLDSI